MPLPRFFRRAEKDLLEIAAYTLRTWGKAQAARYLDNLEGCCEMLANNADLGRRGEEIRPGLRRLEHGRQVIFYRRARTGILVVRVLHQRMLPRLSDD